MTLEDLQKVSSENLPLFHLAREEYFGLQAFFTKKINFEGATIILPEIASQYSMAKDMTLFSGETTRNDIGSTKITQYTPPKYDESIHINQGFLLKSLPSELVNAGRTLTQEQRRAWLVAEAVHSMTKKIIRAKEWQAIQIFKEGKINFASIDILDFGRDPNNSLTAANSWQDTQNSNPLSDLSALSRQIQLSSHQANPDTVIMGHLAFDKFINSQKILDQLNILRLNIGQYQGGYLEASGLIFQGIFSINGQRVHIYTYRAVYQDAGGRLSNYVDANDVIMLDSQLPMITAFAPTGIDSSYILTQTTMGGDSFDVYRLQEKMGLTIGVAGRPLLIHTDINSTGYLKVI